MKISRNDDQLKAATGEAGGGTLTIRADWEDYNPDGRFLAFGSAITPGISNGGQTVFVTAEAPDDGSIRKVVAIYLNNSDIGNIRTAIIYIEKVGVGVYEALRATIPDRGFMVYTVERGLQVYGEDGVAL
jgi:hypothetical protein